MGKGSSKITKGSKGASNAPASAISIDASGNYYYGLKWDDSEKPIDKQSAEYKQALRDNNVKVQVRPDGSVVVAKGGLFTRKKTYANADDFKKDVDEKLNKRISYYNAKAEAVKSGRIPQIQALLFESYQRTHTRHDAIKKMNKDMQSDFYANRMQAAAALDMKLRLDGLVKRIR